MLEKLRQRMRETKEAIGDAAIELLPNKVSQEVQKKRMSICESCDKLYKPTYTCKACGCFMNVKTWMGDQKCPLNKWDKEPAPNQTHDSNP